MVKSIIICLGLFVYLAGIFFVSIIFIDHFKGIDKATKRAMVMFWPLTILCGVLNTPFYLYQKRIERMKRWNEGARNASRRVHAIEELQDKMSELEHEVA